MVESSYGRGAYEVDETNTVVRAAPIWKRFIGRKVHFLRAWVNLYKNTTIEEIPNDKEVVLIK